MLTHLGRVAPLIGPDLLRGARAMLGWSLMVAGQRAGVSIAVVASAEGSGTTSRPISVGDNEKLRSAYEDGGIRFVDDVAEGRGLRIDNR